jgi:hypothetical protein
MGSKPKQSDYKASPAEIEAAKVGAEKAEFFERNYQPLNVAELKDSLSDDVTNLARSRANADVMQALTSAPTYQQTQNAGQFSRDFSQAYQGQLGKATAGAETLQNQRAAAAVGVAQGQSASSGAARSALASIGTSRQLDRAKNNALMKAAKIDAGMRVAGAAGDKMFGAADGEDPTDWDRMRQAYNKASGK